MVILIITVHTPTAAAQPSRNNKILPYRFTCKYRYFKWNNHAVNEEPTANAVPIIVAAVFIVVVTPFVEVRLVLRSHPL